MPAVDGRFAGFKYSKLDCCCSAAVPPAAAAAVVVVVLAAAAAFAAAFNASTDDGEYLRLLCA